MSCAKLPIYKPQSKALAWIAIHWGGGPVTAAGRQWPGCQVAQWRGHFLRRLEGKDLEDLTDP